MTGHAVPELQLDLLVGQVIPDTRVLDGSRRYAAPTALRDVFDKATHVRGLLSGLDHRGVEWLRHTAKQQTLQACHLVLGLYPGCPTWDDVLLDAFEIQEQAAGRMQFRVRARRDGLDRPGNLLWVSRGSEPSVLVVGNLGNGLITTRWDATDANLVLPLTDVGEQALINWFDLLHANSSPLTRDTAKAPRLQLPDGDEEGERLWRDYLAKLAAVESEQPAPVVDPETGAVDHPTDPPPSKQVITVAGVARATFPQPDPVLLAVQAAMARGALVSLDRVDRIPPLDLPIRPEMLGEIGTRRVGGASRRVAYRVSLFDEKTQKQLNNRHADASTRLSAFSLMVRDGQRWMPQAAFSLFEQELAASQQKSREVLLAAIGGKAAADVVTALADKVARELRELAKQAGLTTAPPDSLLDEVLAGLRKRLEGHLGKEAAPGITRMEAKLSLHEDEHHSPWGTVQTFLASAVRLPREVMSDPFRMRGLVSKPEALLTAFDLFGDPLVKRYLDRQRVDDQAKHELEMVDDILATETATPWHRAQALHCLITGAAPADVTKALKQERPTV
ncbi:hypothetical protein [Falsiroseomonas tokyonensis]|uniref:Uncharacterized protein n=1 Tax=Falsiroseomonas tokyonensis TaxID=430521 RepID=A0ABV7C5W6_9PROT|nr:hypothetical protein [Falsiroseomonas tokyonensis]MBU8541698.1 hypothetical protein [Falsiroseomonas tokyonensis]